MRIRPVRPREDVREPPVANLLFVGGAGVWHVEPGGERIGIGVVVCKCGFVIWYGCVSTVKRPTVLVQCDSVRECLMVRYS